MSSELDTIIQLGHDITSHKYHSLATGVVLFYDYFLTLGDEIKYVWSERKSWTFWLFIVIRYFPMTWQFWQLGMAYTPHFDSTICHRTAWYSIAVFVCCTLLAQVMLTLRIYAVMMKNIPITFGFAAITTSQFVLGMWVTIRAAQGGAQALPQIPLDAYHLCLFVRHKPLEIAYTSISLLFDFLAFTLVILWARKSRILKIKVATILDTVAEGATWYFLLIFSSHFALVMTLNLGRPGIQLLPAPGPVAYFSVMVSRTMLSLRKAADLRQNPQPLAEPATNSPDLQDVELPRLRSGKTKGKMTYRSAHI